MPKIMSSVTFTRQPMMQAMARPVDPLHVAENNFSS